MTRISKTQLIQPLDVEFGTAPDAVILDESTGEEIVIQADRIMAAVQVLAYIAGHQLEFKLDMTGEPMFFFVGESEPRGLGQ